MRSKMEVKLLSNVACEQLRKPSLPVWLRQRCRHDDSPQWAWGENHIGEMNSPLPCLQHTPRPYLSEVTLSTSSLSTSYICSSLVIQHTVLGSMQAQVREAGLQVEAQARGKEAPQDSPAVEKVSMQYSILHPVHL